MAKDAIGSLSVSSICDDFYNRDAFMVIGKYLANLPRKTVKTNTQWSVSCVGNTLMRMVLLLVVFALGCQRKSDHSRRAHRDLRVNGAVSYPRMKGASGFAEDQHSCINEHGASPGLFRIQ